MSQQHTRVSREQSFLWDQRWSYNIYPKPSLVIEMGETSNLLWSFLCQVRVWMGQHQGPRGSWLHVVHSSTRSQPVFFAQIKICGTYFSGTQPSLSWRQIIAWCPLIRRCLQTQRGKFHGNLLFRLPLVMPKGKWVLGCRCLLVCNTRWAALQGKPTERTECQLKVLTPASFENFCLLLNRNYIEKKFCF